MAELEDTRDPRELVAGDPRVLHAAAGTSRRVGAEVSGHGERVRRVRISSWEGASGDRFRAAADVFGRTAITDGDQAGKVSTLIEDYAHTLRWAQTQAANAVALFHRADPPPTSPDPVIGDDSPDPGNHHTSVNTSLDAGLEADPAVEDGQRAAARRQEAHDIVSHARAVLAAAGDSTTTAIGKILGTISMPPQLGTGAVVPTALAWATSSTTGTISAPPTIPPPAPPTMLAQDTAVIHPHSPPAPFGQVATTPAATTVASAAPSDPAPPPNVPGAVCVPGPTDIGHFTPGQWAALPGDDPRRTQPTVVVDPPDDHGHHDTLIDVTTRAGMGPDQWHRVWDLNRALLQPDGHPLASPSLIHPGDVLAIPHTEHTDQPPPPDRHPEHPGPDAPPDPDTAAPTTSPPPVFSSGPAKTTGNGNVLLPLAVVGAGAVAVAAAMHRPATSPRRLPSHVTAPDSDTTDIPGAIPSDAAAGHGGAPAGGVLPDNALRKLRSHLDTPVPFARPGQRSPAGSRLKANSPGGRHDSAGMPAPEHRTPTSSTEDTVAFAAQPTPSAARTTPTSAGSHAGAIGHVQNTPTGDDAHWAGSSQDAAGRDSDAPEAIGTDLATDAVPVILGIQGAATVGVDLAALHGLGLTGPSASSATRALLLGLFARTAAGQPGVRVVIETGHARELLAVSDAALAELTQVVCVADLDDGLDLVEFEILRRARINAQGPPEAGFAPMVLLAQPTRGQRARLAAILATGAHLRVAAVIEGPWPTGTQLDLAVDATVTTATGTPALRHTRMFITTAEHARDCLTSTSPSTTTPAPTAASGTGEPGLRSDPAAEPPAHAQPDTRHTRHTSDLDTASGHHTTTAAEGSDPTDPGERLHHAREEAAAVAPRPGVLLAGPGLEEPTVPDTVLLAISCFGQFRVRARTEPGGPWSEITARTPPKHRLLLGYLIAHDGATPDELLEAGWPETTYKQAQQRLQSTLTALRRTWRDATGLAEEPFIALRRDRYHLTHQQVWIDLRELRDTIAGVRGAITDTDTERLLRQAATLYTGGFLTNIDTDWADTTRHTTRADASWVLTQLATRTEPEDPAAAIALLDLALEHNRTDETAAADLIRAHLAHHQPDRARQVYTDLTAALGELNLTPDPTITQLLTPHPHSSPPATPPDKAERRRAS